LATERIGDVSPKTHDSLVFITEMEVVYCAVRTESLNVFDVQFSPPTFLWTLIVFW